MEEQDLDKLQLEQLYRDIFKYAPLGIYTLDVEGRVTTFNPKMQELAGHGADNTIGLNALELNSYKQVGLDVYFREGIKGKPFEVEVDYTSELAHKRSSRFYRGVPLKGTGAPGEPRLLLIVEDITERVRSRRQLDQAHHIEKLERERLAAVLNSVTDGVIAINNNQEIVNYNGAALNLLDFNQGLSRRRLDEVMQLVDGHNQPIDVVTLIHAVQVAEVHEEWRLQYADGELINIYLSIAPVHLGFGKQGERGHVILLRDITKQRSLDEERDEFISVVSHELRTPIAIAEGNLGNAQFIADKQQLDASIKKTLDQAHEQIVFLANMINDLATLSRAERSSLHLDITAVDPAELLERLSKDYQLECQTAGLQLLSHIADGAKLINTSELYLREILQNLITNAIKYTKQGSVVLHVRSDTRGRAVFAVSDTGIGISKSDQNKIFDKFFRSEDYRTRESSGTGLGLYVTQKLASRLRASIDFDSTLNKGTTFTLTVPSLKVRGQKPKNSS